MWFIWLNTTFISNYIHNEQFIYLTAQIGGLLALCLGASIVTVFELIDLTLCGSNCSSGFDKEEKRASKSRKSPDSNHVMFKAVDINDPTSPDGCNSLHMTSLPMSSLQTSYHRQSTPVRGMPNIGANIPKIKIDSYKNKLRLRQAETDI